MDKKSILDLFAYIQESLTLIKKRFEPIKSVDDFLDDELGLEKLDAISMRLQTIGEALKNIDKREPTLLSHYHDRAYWSDIIKLREIISHHYINLDAEIIFDICENELEELYTHITKIIQSL